MNIYKKKMQSRYFDSHTCFFLKSNTRKRTYPKTTIQPISRHTKGTTPPQSATSYALSSGRNAGVKPENARQIPARYCQQYGTLKARNP